MTLLSHEEEEKLGKHLTPGSRHYRAFVSPPDKYDLVSALQFCLLTTLGLREEHTLLDIGCGSLRGGRLFIPYLLSGRYFGIEPEQWLIDDGIKNELGADIINIKQPSFYNDRSFSFSVFNQTFDFILAQSIFSHAAQPQIEQCLAEAKKVMKPTAIFVANFVEGEINHNGNDWVYPGSTAYTLDYMTHLVTAQGLSCKPIYWPHPVGLRWILIVHPEYVEHIPPLHKTFPAMRAELDTYKQRLAHIENHPYVKAGLVINKLLRRIKSLKR
jgi:SAM-dependent methyltransferase